MYNGCNSCGYSRLGGNFSWIIWIFVILFVIGLFDNNGNDCGCDNDRGYNRSNGCGCGCN